MLTLILTTTLILAQSQVQQTPPPPPAEQPPASVNWAVAATPGASEAWTADTGTRPEDRMAPDPLPDWALGDPARYVAEQCAPGVRPGGEESEACFARIEGRLRIAGAPAPRPAPTSSSTSNCRSVETASADGTSRSVQVICGTGGAAEQVVRDVLNGG